MQQSLIILLIFSIIYFVNGCNRNCDYYKNEVYQLTIQIPNQQPFYSLVKFTDGCMVDENMNIVNGNNTAELGIDIQFGPHVGHYACPRSTYVYFTTSGYIYKTNGVAVLATNGAIAVHNYKLYFTDDYQQCSSAGTLDFSFYATGTDPFSRSRTSILSGSGKVTSCKLLKYRLN